MKRWEALLLCCLALGTATGVPLYRQHTLNPTAAWTSAARPRVTLEEHVPLARVGDHTTGIPALLEQKVAMFVRSREAPSEEGEGDGLSKADVRRVFAMLDKDHSKFLTKDEVVGYFSQHASKGAAERMFARMDTDKDGKVSVEDFIRMFFEDESGDKEAKPHSSDEEKQESEEEEGGGVEVNMLAKENMDEHKTKEYGDFHVPKTVKAVLRRGRTFKLSVKGPSGGKLDKDLASTVSVSVGNNTCTATEDPFKSLTWASRVQNYKGRTVNLKVWIPADAAVGKFPVSVSIAGQEHEAGDIFLLFNPYSPYDDVYMKDEKERAEYVESNEGAIWYGDVYGIGIAGASTFAWNFHQYEVVDTVMKMLDFMPLKDRGDPILLSRFLSWFLNSSRNKKGVLTGRWKDDFPGGEKPHTWTGSRRIIRLWEEQGMKPVKYGQCWVFAGIFTTALRALGLPSRPVTTFRSAHDSQPYDLVIDEEHTSESIWNFHVWTEAWMTRRDVKLSDAVWNAVDATPQERSDGKYQMGPAAVPLVAKNQHQHAFDSKFVLGEVNAHVWLGKKKYEPGMDLEGEDVDVEDVGQFISTKALNCTANDDADHCRLDLTGTYKTSTDPFKKHRFAALSQHRFETRVTPARPLMGEPFTVNVKRRALVLGDEIPVVVSIKVLSVSYTGAETGVLQTMEKHCVMTAKASDHKDSCGDFGKGWSITIAVEQYARFVSSAGSVKVQVSIERDGPTSDSASPVSYKSELQFSLKPPVLSLQTEPATIRVNEPFLLKMTVVNPLPLDLTSISASIDTPDFDRKARFRGPIKADAIAQLVTKGIKITEPGQATLAVSLDTDQVPNIAGSIVVQVQP